MVEVPFGGRGLRPSGLARSRFRGTWSRWPALTAVVLPRGNEDQLETRFGSEVAREPTVRSLRRIDEVTVPARAGTVKLVRRRLVAEGVVRPGMS